MDYNLVTVEWEVNEITIEDKYEIVLTAVYETDVPAAVVIAEPTSINLPAMQSGDVYNGEFTVTNHGLVRADNVSFTLPRDAQHFDFEFLGGLPSNLDAKEKITVPFRVTCLLSPDQSGEGGGGGCRRSVSCAVIDYDYTCPAGQVFQGSTLACFIYDNGECTGGSSAPTGGGGGVVWNVGGGTEGGSVSAPAPAPSQIAGVKCFPTCSLKESFFDKLRSWKETLSNMIHQVGCTVNTLTREFNDDALDLAVKVPGGTIEVQRRFYRNQWHWDNTRNNLTFKLNSLGTGIESIEKGVVVYEATTIGSNVFTHDTYRITKTDSVYRWKDKYGNYKDFDETGRMTAYGTRSGVVGKLLYEAGENGKLIGIADRSDNQVIWYEYDVNGRIAAVYDVNNRRVEYAYTDGRLTTVTDVLDNTTTYEYNTGGQIMRKVDAGGRPTIITYDEYNNPASVVDDQGQGHFFEFDYNSAKKEYYVRLRTSSGMIKEIWYDRDEETKRVDVNGRTILSIAKDGRNLIVTDEKNNVIRKEFDEWDNLVKVIYPDESSVLFEYDLRFNKVSRVTDPRGNVIEYVYDNDGNLTDKTEAVGTDAERVTTYTYDDAGQLLTATIAADADTEAATTTFTYDDSGNLATITDPMDHVTQFVEYDNMGNLLRMIDPRNNEWTFNYDQMGRLLSQTDPLGHTTAYEYDGANNRKAVVNALLKRFEFEYDDHNNLIKAIDPYAKFIAADFNTDNLPVRVTDQEGKIFRTEYDNEGRITRSIDGAGNEIVFHYDETDAILASSYRPVQIDYPTYSRKFTYNKMQRVTVATDVLDQTTSHTRSYVYDAAGNVIATADEQGKTTQFEYDALNRLVKTTDPLNGATRRKYDDRGNLIELQDPNNGITFYEYDKNNRLLKVIRPMLEEIVYEYDTVGNRTAVNDTKGQRIEYTYNAINRLTQVRYYAAGDHQNPIKTVDFTYDELGNIKTYNDGTTSATYTYDDLSRKISESVNYGPVSLSYAYTYYANSVKKTFTGPDGNTITYSYDENNRLVGTNIPGQGQITNLFDQAHWNSPAKTMLPGGSTTDYGYDPLMQLKTITSKDPGQNPLMTRSYQHSPAGNVSTKNTEHGNYTYQYDDMYRLTQAVNPTLPDEAYTYDALGNRLTAAGVSGNWTYNANNELTGYDTNAFVYDDNGNMTQKIVDDQTTNFIYDTEDRLIRVENSVGSTLASYYYDPFGRRLWKDVGGVKTYFLYSDEGLIGEYDSTGAEIKTYGWAPDSTWGTDPLFVKISGTYYWYQNDHLGTPQKLTSTNGAVAWAATYTSFGEAAVDASSIIINNMRFAGQYLDEETGLHYNMNRYYDPGIGRYLRIDPFGDGINLYAYVLNNPLSFIDPLGLCAVKQGWDWWKDMITINANWGAVGKGSLAIASGIALVKGGAALSVTGPGAALGVPIVLGGVSAASIGVMQVIVGFTGNELPFTSVGEAVVKIATQPGSLRNKLIAVNILKDMLLSGRVPKSRVGDIITIIQTGLQTRKSAEEIKKELYKAGY